MLSDVRTGTIPPSANVQRIGNRHGSIWREPTAELNGSDLTSTALTDRYDEIRLEDLNLAGMKSLWGRKVSDLGFADFVKTLVYVASKKGVKITFIDKWYPSSKTCSTCGAVNEVLNLRDRTWQCPDCHTELDRDRNAAINIFRVGASTPAGEVVRPPSGG